MRPLFLLLLATVAAVGHAAAPSGGTLDSAALRAALAALAQSSGLSVGYALKDLTTGEEFLHRADDVFPQGSSIRIHLVTELYRQATEKKLSVDEVRTLPEAARTGGTGVLRYMSPKSVAMSLRDYAVLMIAVNDHSAANFLTDVVGLENVNASLAAQGTPEIKFRRRVISRQEAAGSPDNEGTPRAVMRSLELIHRGAVVDRATSDSILEVLSVPEISYFHRELPRGVLFAGRSGSGPTMRCDAGIVRLPNRPFVLCTMVKGLRFTGPRDYAKADAFIAEVLRLALRHFQSQSSPPSAAPPSQSS